MISPAALAATAPPPVAPCPACVTGPNGLEGHSALRASALGSSSMRFVCRDCGALWAREDRGSGAYSWSAVDARIPAGRNTFTGVPLPRR